MKDENGEKRREGKEEKSVCVLEGVRELEEMGEVRGIGYLMGVGGVGG